MLTVDTEALPKRATEDHVRRLILGEHGKGTAGVREMSAVSDEFGVKHIFFVDLCGAYDRRDEIVNVIRWLDGAGQDVQLHTHSEYLPESFWLEHGFKYKPRFLNQYDQAKADFTIQHFGRLMSDITNKPILAYRAGSFRWNSNTIRALRTYGIPLSFNNSTSAVQRKQSTFSEKTNRPFVWSNGVIEIPVTERKFAFPLANEWWGRLQFPVSHDSRNPPWRVLSPYSTFCDSSFMVLLLHSWSLLYWDDKGYAEYRDDKRLEDYRKIVRRLSKDYDVITSRDFLDLYERGEISASHEVDVTLSNMAVPARRSAVKK